MILNSPIISGSLTVTGNIITSGSITISGSIASASYASNADLLDGLDSTVFTLTSSFAAQTASFTAFTASLNAFSASQNSFTASILAQTASLNSFSASILTFTGSAATRLGALESYTSSLNAKTASFATTGSNIFIGTQTITGSVLQSGSFTSTGTLTAQTLVVQTITSSVVYSSGSNVFGNALNNTQTFTGSVLVTGSLTIAGGSSATSYSGATIYGSTAVCSPVGKFTTCIDAGSGNFSSSVTANNLYLTSTGGIYFNAGLALFPYAGHTYIRPYSASGSINFQNQAGSLLVTMLDGGNVGIGAVTPAYKLDITNTVPAATSLEPIALRLYNGSDGGSAIYFGNSVSGQSKISFGVEAIGAGTDDTYIALSTGANAAISERMRITSGGNVGINCSAPSGKLQVANSSTQYALYTAGGNLELYTPEGNCGYVRLGSAYNLNGVYGSCGLNYITSGASYHAFYTTDSATERMRITSCGNVGIGAGSPDATLHICCSAGSANALLAHFQNSGGGTAIATIKIGEGSPEGQYGVLGHYGADNSFRIGSVNGNLSFHAGASTACGTNLYGMCERLTILTNGRVGIGASAPSSKLSVAGAISFTADYDATCPTSIFRENGNKLTLGGGTSGIQFNKSDMSVANVAFLDSGISCFRDLVCTQGGVKFGNGSSTLNYYEEGTWTPQLCASTAFTMGGINTGRYVRVGNQVNVSGQLQWSAGSGVGQVRISGLPFTSSGTRSAGSIGAVSSGISFSSGYGSWILVNDPGYSFMYIIQLSTTGQGYSHEPPVASSGVVYGFSLTYLIV